MTASASFQSPKRALRERRAWLGRGEASLSHLSSESSPVDRRTLPLEINGLAGSAILVPPRDRRCRFVSIRRNIAAGGVSLISVGALRRRPVSAKGHGTDLQFVGRLARGLLRLSHQACKPATGYLTNGLELPVSCFVSLFHALEDIEGMIHERGKISQELGKFSHV